MRLTLINKKTSSPYSAVLTDPIRTISKKSLAGGKTKLHARQTSAAVTTSNIQQFCQPYFDEIQSINNKQNEILSYLRASKRCRTDEATDIGNAPLAPAAQFLQAFFNLGEKAQTRAAALREIRSSNPAVDEAMRDCSWNPMSMLNSSLGVSPLELFHTESRSSTSSIDENYDFL